MSDENLTRVEREALEAAGADPILRQMLRDERIESEELDATLLVRLLAYTRAHKMLGLICVVLAMAESFLMTLPAYMIGLAVDRATQVSERKNQFLDGALDSVASRFLEVFEFSEAGVGIIVFFGVAVMVVWVLRWIASVITTYLVQMLGQRVVHDLRCGVFSKIASMGMDYFHTNPVGRLVNRTTFDVASLSELFSDALAQGFRDLLFVFVLIAVMFSLDVTLALILIASFPLLIGVALAYRALARPSLRTMTGVQSRMNSWLAENLSGMRENQLYRKEAERTAEWHALTEAHQASVTRVIQAWGILRPGMIVVSAAATSIVLWVGYSRVIEGLVTVGILLTFLQYTARLWVPVRNLAEKFNIIQTALTAGERVFDVLDTATSMHDESHADPDLQVEGGQVEFDSVRFTYPTAEELVLKEISFEVEPGTMVALVGDTGAGKSTIVSLISRFYDVDSGEVRVDGRDVRDYTLHNLRRAVALVPQDVFIFAGTLRENITLGREVSDEVILECARAVRAEELIRRFEEGLDHVLEEGGRTLSAGERQLLSFARALLERPPILILDEATASIDTRTEFRIQQALERLTEGRTTIVIAHRLSTIREADQILVLRDGYVVERGTHSELHALGGEYRRLHDAHVE